jgi:hydrogenase-4 component F
MLATLILIPAAAAVLAAVGGARVWVGWVSTAAAALLTVGAAVLAGVVLADGPVTFGGGFLRADALSAFMAILIGSIATLAAWFGVPYLRGELADGHTTRGGARLYGVLVNVFVATMVLAVLAESIGVMWIAIEATTIATAFLVGHRRNRASLEASWKYVMIGSVGIVLAFLGTILVAYAARHLDTGTDPGLSWPALVAAGRHLDPTVMRIAVVLLFLGYGTKVGLAPMHTWLPDAHSQAPAPVSALMSGVLLSVAFYAILRLKVLADLALDPGFARGLLVAGGLLSLGVAASLLIAQRDYKRLLAYSSIEHMGIVAIGAAIGTPLAIAAALLHMLGHGFGKSVVFLGSGELARTEGTTTIAHVRGLLARNPLIGGIFGLGLLGLLGFPPFALFATEVTMTRAAFDAGLGWVMAVALVLIVIAFAAVFVHAQRMLLGASASAGDRVPMAGGATWGPLVVGLVAFAALGISIWPLERLLHAAAKVLVT